MLKKLLAAGLLGLAVLLGGCGSSASTTGEVSPTTGPISNITVSNEPVTLNAIVTQNVATATAGNRNTSTASAPGLTNGPLTASANPTASATQSAALPTQVLATAASSTAPVTIPVYSGFKPLDLGEYGKQIQQQFSQAGANVHTTIYSTSDSFDQVINFYNNGLDSLGYTKAAQQDLPANTLLTGQVVLYGKGAGTDLQGIILVEFGPLDANTIAGFSAVAPAAKGLKPGDSIVVILSGITGSDLTQLQQTFTSGGQDTPTPTT